MIATILPSSANFHAVAYNEKKVAKGVARLLEMSNLGHIGVLSKPTAKEMQDYMIAYSSRNSRIKKAQFHLAISCKGHEKTEEELLQFAHEYLKEMGYGNEGQPLLVYAHTDTDNTHIHIVTSRISPDGKKISDHHERVRSQAVLNKLVGKDVKAKAAEDLAASLGYSFSTFAQYKALMTSMGYEVYEKNDIVFVKRDGAVQAKIGYADICGKFHKVQLDKTRRRQLWAMLKKYRDVSADRKELQAEVKRKLGIDLVFFGKSDNPYGYMIVDHANKTVYNGAWVLSIKSLLDFTTPDDKMERIDAYIDRLLENNPTIDTWGINSKIFRYNAFIRRGVLHYRNTTRPLKGFMAATILRNDKIKRIESFQPTTAAERDLLCSIYKVNEPELVTISQNKSQHYYNDVDKLRRLFNDDSIVKLRSEIRNAGFYIRQSGEDYFAINFSSKQVINLSEEGFDLKRLARRKFRNASPAKLSNRGLRGAGKGQLSAKAKGLRDAASGRGETREWEVGYRGNYDRIDDENSLKV